MPVIPKNKDREAVMGQVNGMHSALLAAGVRARVDAADRSPGWKFNFWEMKGVPVRLEVGPCDVAKGACVLARRDRPGKEGKEFGVSVEGDALVQSVNAALDGVQVRSRLFSPSTRLRLCSGNCKRAWLPCRRGAFANCGLS